MAYSRNLYLDKRNYQNGNKSVINRHHVNSGTITQMKLTVSKEDKTLFVLFLFVSYSCIFLNCTTFIPFVIEENQTLHE